MNSIKITNDLGESITIELARPEQSGFAVLYIEGLGPTKANIALTERSTFDGATYNTAKAESRNILFGFQFHNSHDIATTRRNSYKYFPLKRRVKIEVFAGDREAYVYGYVETNEPTIFSKDSGCIISVLCPKSYLYDLDEAITVFSSVTSLFEFPFSNESLVSPLLEISELLLETEKTVLYEGEAPIGILLHIHANGSASGVTFTNSRTLETLAIDSAKLIATVGADITEGDNFYISTVNGNKYAILIRGGTEYNILNCLGADPTWFQLQKGDNIFAYTATSGLVNLEFRITNDVAYEGI